jgi:formate hydrogenlyase transcriptional activator
MPSPSSGPSSLEGLLEELRRRVGSDDEALALLERLEERYRAEVASLRVRQEQRQGYLRNELQTELLYNKLIGNSPAMRSLRQAIEQVAPTDSTVLITGETGTGKELVAWAIHERSRRRPNLLVKVNCAALVPTLIASELFGHEPGAFTGAAKRRVGRFELAHQGSLFLDEIAEVSPETQVLLLRVLQERTIERVGGGEPIAVDVRLIAATNRDLAGAVAEGRFRSDLFYRLNVFPIRVPPLRERREDVPSLLHHFRVQFNRRMHKQVTRVDPASLELAARYPWPGNVRELENIVERAMIVAPGDTLVIDPTWLAGAEVPATNPDGPGLAEVERRAILDALHRCGGKVYGPDGAAAALGLKPTTLYGKMRKHHIRKRAGTPEYE